MPRIRLLASSLALAICSMTAAQAQQFSNVYSFGDSLSDDGNVAALTPPTSGGPFPAGNSFTTNPDPEAVQIISAAFGVQQTNISPLIPGSSGTDYAYGGACVEANSATFTCGLSPAPFSITTQVTGYLAANGGQADPNALYTMWGGANDIFTYLGLTGAGFITPTQAAQGTAVAAGTEVGLIGALQTAGARNIVVFNLPNIGATPELTLEGPTAAAAATKLVLLFNSQLNLGMAGRTGIIPVNTFGLVNEVLANPTQYGFTNVTGMACATGPGIGGLPSSVACGPEGTPGDLYSYAPGTNQTYFFADGVHPTGAAGQLLAQAVLSEIAAPSYISMLAQTPLQTFETQDRVVHDQFQADISGQRSDGSLRTYASINYSHERYDQTATSPQMGNDDDTLVLGSDYYVNKNISFGLTSTFSHQNASFAGGGGFENNEPLVAAWGLWHADQVWISLLAGVGQLNYNDINRIVPLGPTLRNESGSTDGSSVGVQGAIGYDFKWNDITTGPFASITGQRVKIGSFSENGNDSTSMTFGRIRRDSLLEQVGWELSGNSAMFGNIHPYARVAYSHEGKTDPTQVTAGLVTLNGTFTLPGYTPDSDYWTGELGLSASLGNNMTVFGAYDGLFGNDNERVNSVNVGFKWAW